MGGENNISVGDALISTDVDKLIRTISGKGSKGIDIYSLQKETGIDRKMIDKWIRVLEDEEYVKIEYHFMNTYVKWIGMPSEGGTSETEGEKTHKKGAVASEKTVVMEPIEIPIKENGFAHALGSEVAPPVFGEDEIPVAMNSSATIEKAGEISQNGSSKRPFNAYEEANGKGIAKDVLNRYLDEINEKKYEIGRLKGEKERLYRTKFMNLESQFEEEVIPITEKVLEKEGRILELKERVLGLPDKIGEVEKLTQTIEKLRTEGRSVIENAQERTQQFLADITETSNMIEERIALSRAALENEAKAMEEVSQKHTELAQESRTIQERLEETNVLVASLQERIDGLQEHLKEAQKQREITGELHTVLRDSIEKRKAEVANLENELSQLKQVEGDVLGYLNDYQARIGQIEQYVQNSEEEIDRLREAAEGEYIRKYIRELEGLVESYEAQLESASMEEYSIDERIADARTRLNALIVESKDIIQKIHGQTGTLEPFDSAIEAARSRSEGIEQLIEGKALEPDGPQIASKTKTRKKKPGKGKKR